jgi:type IV pilus assembly protein PilV
MNMNMKPLNHLWCATTFRNQAGFTLIEVLVTGFLLTIGLLGTAGLTAGIIKGNYSSKNISAATSLAKTQLEKIQNDGYSQATAGTTTASVQMANAGAIFTRTTTIVADTPATDMKQVTVVVSWNETNNTARQIQLQSILAESNK